MIRLFCVGRTFGDRVFLAGNGVAPCSHPGSSVSIRRGTKTGAATNVRSVTLLGFLHAR